VSNFKVTFYSETLRRGVMLHPNHQWVLSAAHTDEDVEATTSGAPRWCKPRGYASLSTLLRTK
jgi:glutamate-1-semialdehyde aminotransferase